MKKVWLADKLKAYNNFDPVCSSDSSLIRVELNNKYGFVNYKGEEVIPPIYDQFIPINNGNQIACLNEDWGIIDKEGKIIIPFIYQSIGYAYINNRFWAKENDQYRIIDLKDNIISKYLYNQVHIAFGRLKAAIVERNDKWGTLDICTGQEIIPCKYDSIFINTALCFVVNNKLYGVIDRQGKEIVPCEYDNIKSFGFSEKFVLGIKSDIKYLISIEDGNVVSTMKFDYDELVKTYYDNAIIVRKEDKYGIIDRKEGKLIVDCIYDNIKIMDNDLISCVLNNEAMVILLDKVTNEIIKFDKLVDKIGSRDDTLYYAKCKDIHWLGTGCFLGTLKEFENSVKSRYLSSSVYYIEYMEVVDYLKSTL